MGARRDEERVEEIVVAVERRITGVEVDGHAVVAQPQRRRRHDEMAVDLAHRDSLSVDLDAPDASLLIREPDRQRR